jgi:hypothetical protein
VAEKRFCQPQRDRGAAGPGRYPDLAPVNQSAGER